MTALTRKDFDTIYHPDGTCTNWYCGKQGVVLAYDEFSPEVAHWFCTECWQNEQQEWAGVALLTIVEDHRATTRK